MDPFGPARPTAAIPFTTATLSALAGLKLKTGLNSF